MKIEADRDNNVLRMFKGIAVAKTNVRAEGNRVYLIDKEPKQQSIFNYGQLRHNVHSADLVQQVSKTFRNFSSEPVRLIEWKEAKNQRFDKPVAKKVGEIEC